MAFFIDDEGNITLVQGDDGDVTFDGILILSRPMQASKASLPMLVKLAGRLISPSPIQPSKALSPMLVMPFSSVTLIKPIHPSKAPFKILPPVIVTSVKLIGM